MSSAPSPFGAPPPMIAPPPAKKTPVWVIVLAVVGVGTVLLIGTMAAIAIFGVRRFIGAAKTAEAKNTIGAIARASEAAYDREVIRGSDSTDHRLCGSALPVPATVPPGGKYQPRPGMDFDTGDEDTGWKCLRFSMTMPIYYQYSYQQGSGYVAPSQSPGSDGFEAAARGDLDADGNISLFVVTGRVTSGRVVRSPNIYIEDELE